MQYIRHAHTDEHFVENVRRVCDWAEPGSIELTIRRMKKEPIVVDTIHLMSMVTNGRGDHIIRYRRWQREAVTVSLVNVLEVAWRPDIRRYLREQ